MQGPTRKRTFPDLLDIGLVDQIVRSRFHLQSNKYQTASADISLTRFRIFAVDLSIASLSSIVAPLSLNSNRVLSRN